MTISIIFANNTLGVQERYNRCMKGGTPRGKGGATIHSVNCINILP